MSKKGQKQEKVSVGFYPDVLKMIDEEAEIQHRSRSNMLDIIVRKYFDFVLEKKETSPRPIAR